MRRLIKQIWQLPQAILKRFVTDILRLVLLTNRPGRMVKTGFVLPTTVLLTLMVVLTVTALTYRSFVRSNQAIGQREQQVIVNAATPAIDRAKAKIEFLFRKDGRLPAGLPSSDILYDLMSTKLGTGNFAGYTGRVSLLAGGATGSNDPYTLPDETRIDINGDKVLDNAWTFKSEGKTLVYSILVDDEVKKAENTPTDGSLARGYVSADVDLKAPVNTDKAKALVTRSGPVATTEATASCQGALAEGGWQVVSSQLQKNFQVNAFVANDSDVNQTFTTLEFQQSRQSARGNKWGAWFRYDLEIPLGNDLTKPFNWNGAMHTDGNFILNGGALNLYMATAPKSCVYSRESSELTLGTSNANNFQGQVVKGTMRDDNYTGGNPSIHVFNTKDTAPTPITLDPNNHSVEGGKPSEISVNALTLFTEEKVKHIKDQGTGSWKRRTPWNNEPLGNTQTGRALNDEVTPPYVDDFYRADNRWGPKPRYDTKTTDYDIANQPGGTTTIGDPIDPTTNTKLEGLINKVGGLDGYWERQATNKGLRLIVGQRLELGNTNGWGVPPSATITPAPPAGDPLYPANASKTTLAATNTVIGGDHEYLQRKALRDNLAAVQGMVVYHYDYPGGGDFPAACVALTAHPGTRQTIVDSRSFGTWLSGGVKTDFLSGKGTNGWEFQFPSGASGTSDFDDPLSFANAIGSGQPLGNALRNLAYFAGDPKGGAPSFKPVQDTFAHPFPHMAMWGDFSVLRRILDGNPAYSALSPADQTTLHSAACTLGMLAYNLKGAEDESTFINGRTADLGNLAASLLAAIAAADATTPHVNLLNERLEVWRRFLPTTASFETFDALARWGNIKRDREFGFAWNTSLPTTNLYTLGYGGNSYQVTCDPSSTFTSADATQRPLLLLAFCSKAEPPKYPSLFYLFPNKDHDQTGTGAAVQPATEEYIDQKYFADVNAPTKANYKAVTPASISLLPRASDGSNWVLPVTNIITGQITTTNLENIPDNPFKINVGATSALRVPFLDKGIYDGREQLNTRVLDIDLEALTTQEVAKDKDYWLSANLEKQAEGVFYAFREDAVREDEIVRPKNPTAANCESFNPSSSKFNIESTSGCLMRAVPGVSQDPPLTAKLVSLKPVDFIGDPERRPYGFRLRTASGKPADFSGNSYTRNVGMTFVTDNSVYVMGDFNLHSTDGMRSGAVEEFTQTLYDKPLDNNYFNLFYNRSTLNTANFANLSKDHWRPVEILSDSFSVISSSFRDGAVEDSFVKAMPTTQGQGSSSYMNQNRPVLTADLALNQILRENPNNPQSSAWIDRNGTYYVNPGSGMVAFYNQYTKNIDDGGCNNDCWQWFTRNDAARSIQDVYRRRNLQTASDTFVNAVLVSGIVPKRPQQGYGGLHNYPRLLEYWRQSETNYNTLYISGSFLQLNFATAATGPYEQDAWEPGNTPQATEPIGYYAAPNRRWGYDVGLLYVPPAPAARRFVTFSAPRSEYYREVPADDPYIVNLRCAKYKAGNLVRPDTCPA